MQGVDRCTHETEPRSENESLIFVRGYDLCDVEHRVLLLFHRMLIMEICCQLSKANPVDDVFQNLYQDEHLDRDIGKYISGSNCFINLIENSTINNILNNSRSR